MTLTDFFTATARLSGLLFIVTSMLAVGMSLTIPMIMQPLKNERLVALAMRQGALVFDFAGAKGSGSETEQ